MHAAQTTGQAQTKRNLTEIGEFVCFQHGSVARVRRQSQVWSTSMFTQLRAPGARSLKPFSFMHLQEALTNIDNAMLCTFMRLSAIGCSSSPSPFPGVMPQCWKILHCIFRVCKHAWPQQLPFSVCLAESSHKPDNLGKGQGGSEESQGFVRVRVICRHGGVTCKNAPL